MPGRNCTVCTHPKLAEINKVLLKHAGSKSSVSARFGITPSAVQRHRSQCLGHKPREGRLAKVTAPKESLGSGRFESGRCQACGTLTDDPSPQALVKRAERVLFFAESIMQKAIDEDDSRLGLQAVDRARSSLDQLLKVHGLLQPEGGTTVVVNQEVMTLRKALSTVVGAIDEPRRADALTMLVGYLEPKALVTIEAESAMVCAGETALADVTDNRV